PELVRLVPGNHDRYIDAPWADTLDAWSAYLEPRTENAWPRVWEHEDLCVIGLDCAVPSRPFMATGTLGAPQLEGLRVALRTARERRQFRLVMLHHSPLPWGHRWRKRLTDAHALLAIIDAEGAELIVHGHGHQEAQAAVPARDSECHVFSVPSASYAVDGRAGWNLIRVDAQDAQWSIEIEARRWSSGTMHTAWTRCLTTSRA
ncbi:MAG: metallophosphoesterase, partial [Gammaproteobacteria bacterium]|nr:metallophosphoesterase [Gammaproteobacteria bacterium]